MNIVFAKLMISLVGMAVLGIFIAKRDEIIRWLDNKATGKVLAASWILLRLVPFIFVYVIVGFYPTSDVKGFWDEGSKASAGQIVYRDFWSPYSPLYPYFLGIWLKIWYSPKMIVLTMGIMDGIALLASWHFFRPFQSRGTVNFKILLYMMMPGSLILCVIGAQEDVWMWLFVVLAYLVRERTVRVEWYALILAFGLLFTKAIFVLILVPLFLVERQKVRFLIPIAIVGLVSLGILYYFVGLKFMQPLDEAKVLRAPNFISILNPWFFNSLGAGQKFWNWTGLILSIGLGSITALRLKNADFRVMLSKVWVVLYATMMVVQQSAYSSYIFLFLIPLIFYIIDWNNYVQVGLLFVFNFLCVIHPSYWWRLGMVKYLKPSDIFSRSDYTIDYVIQVSIVLLTCYFVWLSFPIKSKADRGTSV